MKIEKLTPAFKEYLWGGTKLRDVYRKPCDFDKVAESWELSTHPAGESRIFGGEFDGMTLNEYFKAHPEVLGENVRRFDNFPVLIKLIDAKSPLSIQVHPSDEYALEHEHEYGKTEMWYIVDCDPGASLYFGVNRAITPEEFRKRIEDNTVEEVLNRAQVHPGDVFFIEAGTLHAIGAGILICEIQQNSNCTYRVYDYGRLGADGKPRELHIEKALAVSKLTPAEGAGAVPEEKAISGGSAARLGQCKYFTTDRYTVDSEICLDVGGCSFMSLTAVKGSGQIIGPENTVEFAAGDTVFIPADTGAVTVKGKSALVAVSVKGE